MILDKPVKSTDSHRKALFVGEESTIKLITWFKIIIFTWKLRENYLKYNVKTGIIY